MLFIPFSYNFKSCEVFERFFLDKTVQKPLKPLILKQDFERNFLKKPLKPLKSCFKLGEKSRLGKPIIEDMSVKWRKAGSKTVNFGFMTLVSSILTTVYESLMNRIHFTTTLSLSWYVMENSEEFEIFLMTFCQKRSSVQNFSKLRICFFSDFSHTLFQVQIDGGCVFLVVFGSFRLSKFNLT